MTFIYQGFILENNIYRRKARTLSGMFFAASQCALLCVIKGCFTEARRGFPLRSLGEKTDLILLIPVWPP